MLHGLDRGKKVTLVDMSMARRDFLKALAVFSASTTLTGCSKGPLMERFTRLGVSNTLGEGLAETRPMARYPEKAALIMLADRPPLLETPMHYFLQDLTPNDAYFVRWHFSGIPTSVDLGTWRLQVGGAVRQPLALSFDDLRTKFDPVTLVAFNQCSGNSRFFFQPQVPGGQWTNGAMGNARWTGVRLKDILDRAGVNKGAVEASLRGLDIPPLQASPRFEKSLSIDHLRDGEVMVAYEMNGAPLPLLNGFPVRLVVPGWYATYWVKSFSVMTVLTEPLHNFWMDKAYRIPTTPDANEDPNNPSANTIPINKFSTRALFVRPNSTERVARNHPYPIEGIAVDSGAGIRRVQVSTDGGNAWADARLDPVIDKYSWRRWRTEWQPLATGKAQILCRATNNDGETQPQYQWNHGGYQRNVVQAIDVEVV
ncbi:MAG: molybdopterin-dependent oxidoreductase [Terriglobales bacterium]